jgi:hypothetical protein
LGAELCATQFNPAPNASDCVIAYDETYKGRVDLTRSVVVGEPVKKSALRWSVPYNVKDAAGNSATTVWRDVLVEEVDLASVETRIREEVLQQKKAEIQLAVDKALEAERRKGERGARDRKTPVQCPVCPKCDNPGISDESSCQAVCDARIQHCAIDEESVVVRVLLWLERFFPPSMVPIVLSCTVIVVSFLMLRSILTLIFNPQAYRRGYYDDVERERAMMKAVVYHDDGATSNNQGPRFGTSPQPQVSSTGMTNGYFSPQMQYPVAQSAPFAANQYESQSGERFTEIYQSPTNSIITPSKRGDGVRRRSPYSANSRSSM